MKKLLFLLLLILGCGQHSFVPSVDVQSGALCQGSRAWHQRNVCGEGNQSGLCIRVVDGPLTLTEFRTSGSCTHPIMAAIKETYSAPDVDMTPRWEVKSGPMTPAILQNSAVSIHAGESLFVGTEGYNSTVDSSCCYVTWKGYRPGSRFTE